MTRLQYVCLQLLGAPKKGKATRYELKWDCPFCGRLTLRCLPSKRGCKDRWKCDGCIRREGTGRHDDTGRYGDAMDLLSFVFAEPYPALLTRERQLNREYERSGAAHLELTPEQNAGSVGPGSGIALGPEGGGIFSPRGCVATPPADSAPEGPVYYYELNPLEGTMKLWRVTLEERAAIEAEEQAALEHKYGAGRAWEQMSDEERLTIKRACHIARRYDVKLEHLASVSSPRSLKGRRTD
jgi:hypothetical protein